MFLAFLAPRFFMVAIRQEEVHLASFITTNQPGLSMSSCARHSSALHHMESEHEDGGGAGRNLDENYSTLHYADGSIARFSTTVTDAANS